MRATFVADTAAQQRVALLQHTFVVGARRVVARREHRQQLVEVAAPLRRAVLHEREVVGCEHRDAQQAVQIARARDRLLVAQDPVAAGGADLGFEELLAFAGGDLGAHDRLGRHPDRTSCASSTCRNERARAIHPTASSTLVLPCPLAPTSTVSPGASVELGFGEAPEVA